MEESVSKTSAVASRAISLGAQLTAVDNWQVPGMFTSVTEELDALRRSAGLIDASPFGRILIEGTAAARIATALGATTAGILVYRIRDDQYLAHTRPGLVEIGLETAHSFQESGELTTITDMSHGWSEIRIAGPQGPALLSKLCGLDFHLDRFTNGTTARSSVAKTWQLIVRQDVGGVPVFALIGPRSLALYLWDTILDAGGELNLTPVGYNAFRQLEGASGSE